MVLQRPRRCASGASLIDVYLAIGILLIVVVGSFAIYSSVRAALDRQTALANVGVIRSAVATWARDRPLRLNTADGLENVAQLRPWLPGRLGERADESSGLTLGEANPWDGDYRIEPAPPRASGDGETSAAHLYRFVLGITDVSDDEAEALCRQLEDGAALDEAGNRVINFGSRGTGGCTIATSDEADAETQDLYIEYRV